MSKSRATTNSRPLIVAGVFIAVLSNPLLYLMIASIMLDIQNFFGASIDRRSVSFDTDDPFIQAMGLVTIIGLIPLGIGLWKRWVQK